MYYFYLTVEGFCCAGAFGSLDEVTQSLANHLKHCERKPEDHHIHEITAGE